MMANARSATELQVLPRSDDDDRAPLSSSELQLLRASAGDWCAALFLIGLGFYLDKFVPPFERSVVPQLHDPDISYPHTPSNSAHVPVSHLYLFAFAVPLVAVVALSARGRAHAVAEAVLGLLSSLAVALVAVCIIKSAVGRLRPDFLARCQPAADGRCTGDAHVVMEGRKSFPSGHTALSFAGLGYCSLWLGARLCHASTPRLGALWKAPAALLPWTLALGVALSRIGDYWHHWQDVLVGGLIGHATAYGAYRLRYPPLAQGDVPHTLRHLRPASVQPARLALGDTKRSPPVEPHA